ncbi:MAG: AraC family transcriptional regulator [Spirosomataceae bacterium]|jgi:AraC-like DNA-binding protein|nr:AraC family transcriptional regulator [Flectobacillus sp.]
MKPLFQKVPVKLESSFSIRHDVRPNFGGIWHYHPELELHYIIRGEGVRFIGDNISNFSHGEIVLVGENLPHTWRCKEEYFQNDPDLKVEAVVIQFLPDCLGKGLINLPEAYLLPKLYERAKSGLIIVGETRERLTHLLKAIPQAKNLERIALMVSILHLLAETSDYETIARGQAFYQSNETDTIRLNKVCNYTLSNYKKDITLEEISAISNLSVTSFCRYFKLMTKKTYYDFLIEIRISHACRALVEDKLPTEVICFDCGFNNVSNFYRHFKKVTGITPLEYKRKYHTK